ncbi:unnamed protein product, partial [Brassica rapa]
FGRNKIFIPPCIRLHYRISFSPSCYCCVGTCSQTKEECRHQYAILNPPHSSKN